jgi:hypothetical protein
MAGRAAGNCTAPRALPQRTVWPEWMSGRAASQGCHTLAQVSEVVQSQVASLRAQLKEAKEYAQLCEDEGVDLRRQVSGAQASPAAREVGTAASTCGSCCAHAATCQGTPNRRCSSASALRSSLLRLRASRRHLQVHELTKEMRKLQKAAPVARTPARPALVARTPAHSKVPARFCPPPLPPPLVLSGHVASLTPY